MKKVILLACMLIGCGGAASEPTPGETTIPINDSYNYDDLTGDNGGVPCDRINYVRVTVGDETKMVAVPGLCNPNVDLRGGDPAPDFFHGDPLNLNPQERVEESTRPQMKRGQSQRER